MRPYTQQPSHFRALQGGAWRVAAEPEWKRHLEKGLAWGGQIQGWGERPEVVRTPEFGSGDHPIILGAPGHRAPISSRAPYTLYYSGLYTLPPAGEEYLGTGPMSLYSSAWQTAGIRRPTECQFNIRINDKPN